MKSPAKNSEEEPLKPSKEGSLDKENKKDKKLTQSQNYEIIVNKPGRDAENFVARLNAALIIKMEMFLLLNAIDRNVLWIKS